MTKRDIFARCLTDLTNLKHYGEAETIAAIGIEPQAAKEYLDLYISDFTIDQACPEDYVDDFWEWISDPADMEVKYPEK